MITDKFSEQERKLLIQLEDVHNARSVLWHNELHHAVAILEVNSQFITRIIDSVQDLIIHTVELVNLMEDWPDAKSFCHLEKVDSITVLGHFAWDCGKWNFIPKEN